MTRTHIDTLADNTPKSRRRVRRTLNLPTGGGAEASGYRSWVGEAQQVARKRELQGAASDARKRQEGGR